MTTYDHSLPLIAKPEKVRVITRPYTFLLFLAALAFGLIAWRFAVGLGRTTALSDGYPWGLWIAFDVVTGTALACGGYAMALLVYIFNKGKYHPLVRPAILTSALGYSIAGVSVMIDVGRPWMAWRLPLPWNWNLNSVLLEVAVCIMAYTIVLWIEFSPVFFEKYQYSKSEKLQRFSRSALKFFDKALLWIIALGILLPTMHQSSLGSLMLLAGPRLHPLWNTPLLPLFYLITCLAMGYAVVVFESSFSSIAFGHRTEMKMLRTLQKVAAWGTLLFVVARFGDLAWRGRLGLLTKMDLYGISFWIETVLFLSPMYFALKKTLSLGALLRGAMLVGLAGGLYRFNTFLVAYDPNPGYHYFPSVQEQLITIGLVAAEIAIYIALVKNFPVLRGMQKPAPSIAR